MKTDRTQYEAEDRRLVDQYRRTRSDADFEKIVARFESLLMNYAMKYRSASRDAAFDAAQDAFLWLLENVDSLDVTESVAKQFYRTIRGSLRRNRLNPDSRVKSRISFFSDFGDDRSDPVPFEETLSETGMRPKAAGKTPRKKIKVVRDALDALTPRLREAAVSAFCWNDTNRKAYAAESGCCYTDLMQRIETAKARLEKNPELRELVGLEPVPMPKRSNGRRAGLSERQVEVVRLIHDKGASLKEAARRLGVYPHTARYNWRSALKKIAASRELQTLTGIGPGMYGI